MNNEIMIDKDKFLKSLEFNFYGNTLADIEKKLNECELPNPWKLWSEEKPDWSKKIEIKLILEPDDDLIDINGMQISHPKLQWRYVDE